MKARILILAGVALIFLGVGRCQTDNTFYAKQFPGPDVGTKVGNAMKSCNPNSTIPCILVIDPSLAAWAQGTMPTLCAQCTLWDYRTPGSLAGYPGVVSDGAFGLNVQGNVKAASMGAKNMGSILHASFFATGGVATPASPFTSPSNTGGVQECINALPYVSTNAAPSTCQLDSGYYYVSAPISWSQGINLIGTGWNSVLWVTTAINSSTDILSLNAPTGGTVEGGTLADFAILQYNGTPGRYAININSGTGVVRNLLISHLKIAAVNSGTAIYVNGSNANGSIYLSTIRDSSLQGGIDCENCGDSFRILANSMGGAGLNQFDWVGGAAGFEFAWNSVTLKGGTQINFDADAPNIAFNEFETPSGFTGSNGALLDLNGGSGSGTMSGGLVMGNSFATVNGNTTNNIRVNGVTGVTIKDNFMERGSSPSVDIVETAASTKNNIMQNFWLEGGPVSSMISDSGSTNYNFLLMAGQRAGAWSIAVGQTTGSVSFSPPMWGTPASCSITPQASVAATGTPYYTSPSATGITVNVPTAPTGSALTGTYYCGNGNTF